MLSSKTKSQAMPPTEAKNTNPYRLRLRHLRTKKGERRWVARPSKTLGVPHSAIRLESLTYQG